MAAGAWMTDSGLTTHTGNEQGGSVEGSPRWLFYLQGKPVCTEPHTSFLLDVLQDGRAGVHHRFEGVLTPRRHAFVRVEQHRQPPIGFVDFVP